MKETHMGIYLSDEFMDPYSITNYEKSLNPEHLTHWGKKKSYLHSFISSIPTMNYFRFSGELNMKLDLFLRKIQDHETLMKIVQIWATGKKTHKLILT